MFSGCFCWINWTNIHAHGKKKECADRCQIWALLILDLTFYNMRIVLVLWSHQKRNLRYKTLQRVGSRPSDGFFFFCEFSFTWHEFYWNAKQRLEPSLQSMSLELLNDSMTLGTCSCSFLTRHIFFFIFSRGNKQKQANAVKRITHFF